MTATEVYYQQPAYQLHQFDTLRGCQEADVCVVGGGFAGLNCALGLVERGAGNVTLLEAKRIAYGASGRNGGFVFGGYSLDEQALLDAVGPEQARSLYRLTLQGVDLIRRRIADGIDCDYNPAGVLWTNWFTDDAVLKTKQALLAEQYGVDWSYLRPKQVSEHLNSDRYSGALLERNAFHFQPYRFAQGLVGRFVEAGGRVFECSRVDELQPVGSRIELRTGQGALKTSRVVFCGGGYQAGCRYALARAVMPIATFVMVTEPLGQRLQELMPTPFAVYDSRFAFDYYRPLSDGRLLWGGRIAGFDASYQRIERLLRKDLGRVFPQLNGVGVDYVWSGLMGYTRHQMPQLGCLNEQMWYAQGFGGHGVSTSTIGGELIAQAIASDDQTWRLFEPFGLRSTWGTLGQLAAQTAYWWRQGKDWWREHFGAA